jgi:hypothetical protein
MYVVRNNIHEYTESALRRPQSTSAPWCYLVNSWSITWLDRKEDSKFVRNVGNLFYVDTVLCTEHSTMNKDRRQNFMLHQFLSGEWKHSLAFRSLASLPPRYGVTGLTFSYLCQVKSLCIYFLTQMSLATVRYDMLKYNYSYFSTYNQWETQLFWNWTLLRERKNCLTWVWNVFRIGCTVVLRVVLGFDSLQQKAG